MVKYKLTNPFDHKLSSDKSFFLIRKSLSKYKWFLLIFWTILIGVAFYYIGKAIAKSERPRSKKNSSPSIIDTDISSEDSDETSSTYLVGSKSLGTWLLAF